MFFWRSQIWILSLQSGVGPQILKLKPISICSLKIMGKNLQNELWARPVPFKLSERRPPTLYLGGCTENGEQRVIFAFWPITPMQNLLRGIQGMPQAYVQSFLKMWWFLLL